VKAEADRIGVTGFIQRFHANDLKLGFEGSEQQYDDFMYWLGRLRSDYRMIERFESIVDARQLHNRYHDSFQKLMDHSRLKENGGKVCRGQYSEGDMDKLSEFSADMDSLDLTLRRSAAMKNDVIAPPHPESHLTASLPIKMVILPS
jgi:acylphosphatase